MEKRSPFLVLKEFIRFVEGTAQYNYIPIKNLFYLDKVYCNK